MTEQQEMQLLWRLQALEFAVRELAGEVQALAPDRMQDLSDVLQKRFQRALLTTPLPNADQTPPPVYGRVMALLGFGEPPEADRFWE